VLQGENPVVCFLHGFRVAEYPEQPAVFLLVARNIRRRLDTLTTERRTVFAFVMHQDLPLDTALISPTGKGLAVKE
jgi:hypothetical protein